MLSGALERYEHAPVGLARLHRGTPGCLALRPLPHPDSGLAVPQLVREQGRRAALTVSVLISAVFVLFTPTARGLSFRLTCGKVVDTRADNDAPGT